MRTFTLLALTAIFSAEAAACAMPSKRPQAPVAEAPAAPEEMPTSLATLMADLDAIALQADRDDAATDATDADATDADATDADATDADATDAAPTTRG